jgi:hypothetical protein
VKQDSDHVVANKDRSRAGFVVRVDRLLDAVVIVSSIIEDGRVVDGSVRLRLLLNIGIGSLNCNLPILELLQSSAGSSVLLEEASLNKC